MMYACTVYTIVLYTTIYASVSLHGRGVHCTVHAQYGTHSHALYEYTVVFHVTVHVLYTCAVHALYAITLRRTSARAVPGNTKRI